MKTLFHYILYLFPLLTFSQSEIWVATDGSNTGSGTKEEPLKSIDIAIRKARDLRRIQDDNSAKGITIYLKEGTYTLASTLKIRPEDSGSETSETVLKGEKDGQVVISGGLEILHWKQLKHSVPGLSKAAQQQVWVASIPFINGSYLHFRQLWVNDVKAHRASNLDAPKLDRILGVNKQERTFTIPLPKHDFHDLDELEFVIHQWWAIAALKMQSITKQKTTAEIAFQEPAAQIEFEHPWPAPFIDEKQEYNGNSAYYWTGAAELLDHPGEWYADFKNGMLYYWPRKGEYMQKARVIAPHLETLLAVEGNLENPVAHVKIENVSFQHATWMRPSAVGHVPLQAGFYIEEGYKLDPLGTAAKPKLDNLAWLGRQSAAVTITNANAITFSNCEVKHVAATGIDLISGVKNSAISGSIFTDIGGTAIQAGFFGNADFEAHLPYNPEDHRVVVENIEITNNVIKNATNEDWGCVGIGVGFAAHINISHNDISDVNYSGISLGWGWTKAVSCLKNNTISANKIHHFAKQMYDVAGIYTLSAQPGTVISENVIYGLMKAPYAHMPHHHQYIYLDEGSSYMRIENNWTELDKFFCNANGPGNEWENNGVHVSEEIQQHAGLEPEYQYLLNTIN